MEKVELTPEFQKLLDPFREMMNNVTLQTGRKMKSCRDIFLLYHELLAMQSLNQTIPDWAEDIFSNGELLKGTYLEYKRLKYTEWIRKINGG